MKYDKKKLIDQAIGLTRNDFIFFWGHQDRENKLGKACLSQWYMCQFVVRDVYFNCAEQYMMAEKAYMFGDEDVYHQILREYNQMEIKKLGRKVRNFNDYVWKGNRMSVVIEGNLAKFSQNKELMDFLLSTGDKILVEASPKDTIWGIGLDESSSDAINPRNWKGDNLLGFALMEVRDILRGNVKEEPADITKTLMMWTSGAGNSGKRFNGENPMPKKKKKAEPGSWNKPIKDAITIPQNFFLNKKQMDIVQYGHIPDAMEDHWFMYTDENSINYIRSWTGIAIFRAKYKPFEDGYLITELNINGNKDEYRETNLDSAVALFYALLVSEFGGNSAPYWNVAF